MSNNNVHDNGPYVDFYISQVTRFVVVSKTHPKNAKSYITEMCGINHAQFVPLK